MEGDKLSMMNTNFGNTAAIRLQTVQSDWYTDTVSKTVPPNSQPVAWRGWITAVAGFVRPKT